MKMNKPEMEVVRFEVADVIATSGGPIIQYFEYWIQEGKAGLPDREFLYNASTGVFGDLASLKSQFQIQKMV